jgi:hypothetical protein
VYFFVHATGDAPLMLWAHQGDLYPHGAWLANPAGELVFQAGYRGRVGPTLAALLGRLPQNKPGVFGQVWFYIALFAGLVAALAYAAAGVVQRLRAEARRSSD